MNQNYPWSTQEPKGIIRLGSLACDKRLYRYVDFERFEEWLQTGKTSLTRARSWTDEWEVPIAKLLRQHTPKEFAEVAPAFDDQFAQCWCTHRDDEKMWRDFCSGTRGVMVGTRANRFDLIGDLRYGILAPVVYDNDIWRGIRQASLRQIGLHQLTFLSTSALVKRATKYAHENEVRLVAVRGLSFPSSLPLACDKFVSLPLDPVPFVEEILVHPGSSSAFLAEVGRLCSAKGLCVVPELSQHAGGKGGKP